MPDALIFGGSGQLGVAVASELLSTGWAVRIVTREGRRPSLDLIERGVLVADGTGMSRSAVILGLGRMIDAVFDPTAYGAADADDLLQVRHRFGGLSVVSSASVYAGADGRSLIGGSESTSGAIGEDMQTVAAGDSGYAERKVAMEHALLASGVPVSVLRPCAIYGPNSTHPREWWFLKRALDARKWIPVAYRAQSVFHTSSASGIARLAAMCMAKPEQRVLNVADDDALSVEEIATVLADVTGFRISLVSFEGHPVGDSNVGASPWSTEQPFVLDTGRARSLGWNGGTYRENIGETCHWILDVARAGDWKAQFSRFSHYGYDPFDYTAEDEFLASR